MQALSLSASVVPCAQHEPQLAWSRTWFMMLAHSGHAVLESKFSGNVAFSVNKNERNFEFGLFPVILSIPDMGIQTHNIMQLFHREAKSTLPKLPILPTKSGRVRLNYVYNVRFLLTTTCCIFRPLSSHLVSTQQIWKNIKRNWIWLWRQLSWGKIRFF